MQRTKPRLWTSVCFGRLTSSILGVRRGVTANLWAMFSLCGNRVLELDGEDGLDALPSPGSHTGQEGGLWGEALAHPGSLGI